eukprot:CAMPEP_0172455408 /NCGR_PEP_ID=MMETSP1065-20121228/12051_1 /TAXON_ID=265537 /ORGANISM="Amphiprora paludosa, Strain CCMP125" /LENGTH=609 /DNA_ID=CAMNT_0013207869 /DNA_START=207 /DNA_END=2036 /DNA_ORIENTATION=-
MSLEEKKKEKEGESMKVHAIKASKSAKTRSPAYDGKGKGGKKSSLPLCNEYCSMLDSYPFPTTSYTIDMTLSIVDTPAVASEALQEHFQSEIAASLSVCHNYTEGGRRLEEADGSILAIDFSVTHDTASPCNATDSDPSLVGTCAKFLISSVVTYDIGEPDQFVGEILDAVTEECDSIRELEPVEEAFDPCPYIGVTHDIDDEGPSGDDDDDDDDDDEGGDGNTQQGVDTGDDDDGSGTDGGNDGDGTDQQGIVVSTDAGDDKEETSDEENKEENVMNVGNSKAGGSIAAAEPEDSDSNRGRKIGASLGVIFGLMIVGCIICFLLAKRRNRGDQLEEKELMDEEGEKDGDEENLTNIGDDTTVDSCSPGRPVLRSQREAVGGAIDDEESPSYLAHTESEDDLPISVRNPQPPMFSISEDFDDILSTLEDPESLAPIETKETEQSLLEPKESASIVEDVEPMKMPVSVDLLVDTADTQSEQASLATESERDLEDSPKGDKDDGEKSSIQEVEALDENSLKTQEIADEKSASPSEDNNKTDQSVSSPTEVDDEQAKEDEKPESKPSALPVADNEDESPAELVASQNELESETSPAAVPVDTTSEEEKVEEC